MKCFFHAQYSFDERLVLAVTEYMFIMVLIARVFVTFMYYVFFAPHLNFSYGDNKVFCYLLSVIYTAPIKL